MARNDWTIEWTENDGWALHANVSVLNFTL